jgi:hypothetical protein
MECPMSLPNDLSRSPVPFEQESTLVAASGEETALLPRSNAMECQGKIEMSPPVAR